MKKHAALKWKLFAAVFAAFVVLCAQPICAFALELRIRNDFDRRMFVGLAYFDGQAQKWRTRGWYDVEPRNERKLNFNNAARADVYIHAYLSGNSMTWGSGDITRTVTGDAFSYFDGEACPPGRNRRAVNFTKYTARNNVVEFRPTAAIADAPMRIAGDGAVQTPSAPAQSGGGGNTVDNLRAQADELLNLINAERRKVGAPALQMDETMRRAAERRASELITKYSHERPDGSNYSTVFAEFGIALQMSSENIAWREGSATHTNMASFNTAFMNSSGHRTNMLNPDYAIAGLGVARVGNKYFVAELFGRSSTAAAAQDKSLSESLKELEQSLRELGDLFR